MITEIITICISIDGLLFACSRPSIIGYICDKFF